MINHAILEKAAEFIRHQWCDLKPQAGLILGSGWGDVTSSFHLVEALPYEKIPGLGKTGVAGHSGRLLWCESEGLETLIFQGRRHYYEGEGWTPVAIPVFLLKTFGAGRVLLTNAAGGVREDLRPGRLMALTDHINHMGGNPLLGPHHPFWGPRFPDQTAVYDPGLRTKLRAAAEHMGEELAEGVYLAGSGPAYETPAEIRAYRALGADAVGMSTVPEAMLAKAAGLRVAGLSCVTNLAAGISPEPLSHEEVTAATQAAMPRMKALIHQYWKELAREP